MSANLAALDVLAELGDQPATPEQQETLSRWSSWGAVPQVFDPGNEQFAGERAEVASRLSQADYRAAERTTINAHYTDPAIVGAMWHTLHRLGTAAD